MSHLLIRQGQTVSLVSHPEVLASGAVQIVPNTGISSFSAWTPEHHKEAYQLIQKVVQVWKKQGISDYLVYGKESKEAPFVWEVVPYPKSCWSVWRQLQVLWRVSFGGTPVGLDEQQRVANNFLEEGEHLSPVKESQEKTPFHDAFCREEVIQKQLVHEGGEHAHVLYNYAPVVLDERKLHFLLVAKKHRETFADLSEGEYVESMQLSQKLIRFYEEKGYPTAYLYHKSGVRAGQTIPHWHEHLIFVNTKIQEFVAKLRVLKGTLICSSFPLSQKELQSRVASLKEELLEI